jgi:hypothetical protein
MWAHKAVLSASTECGARFFCALSRDYEKKGCTIVAKNSVVNWSHFKALIYLNDKTDRVFYIQMSIIENWSIRELNKKPTPCFSNKLPSVKSRRNLFRLNLTKQTSVSRFSVQRPLCAQFF